VCIIMCNIMYRSIGHRFSKRRELSAAVDVCSRARALFVYVCYLSSETRNGSAKMGSLTNPH